MTYQQILTDIQRLSMNNKSTELTEMHGVNIRYERHVVTSADVLIDRLKNILVCSGWITWPDQVQRIDTLSQVAVEQHHAPLEAELWLPSGESVRLNYRDQQWIWITIGIEWLAGPSTANQANALADIICLKARQHEHQDLRYARIWQTDETRGTVNTDAIFLGFAGEQS